MERAKLDIRLEHDIDEQYQYEPGEILRGCVSIYFPKPTNIRHITIQIKGEANVAWEEVVKQKKNRAREIYINVVKKLLVASKEEKRTLAKGTHDFPFQYQLPDNIPSSFIGKHGSITYVVKATLQEDTSLRINPTIISEPFLVLRRANISHEKALLQPFECEMRRRYYGILCINGHVIVKLKINRRVHLPGEDIFLSAEVSNESPKMVKAMQASLVMVSKFWARHIVSTHSQIVNKKRDAWEMAIGEGRRWRNVRLTIPPYIPESKLDGCDIMETSYALEFSVDVADRKPVLLSIPLLIGTEGIDKADQNLHPSHVSETDEKPKHKIYRPTEVAKQNGHVPTPDQSDDLELPPRRDSVDSSNSEFGSLEMNPFEYDAFRKPLKDGETKHNPVFKHSERERRPSWGTWVSTKTENTRL